MSLTINELKALEEKAQRELYEIRSRRERAEAVERAKRLEPLKKLADKAHDILCRNNHTDGCSWGYEGDDWSCPAHDRWLRHMERLTTEGTGSDRVPLTVAAIDAMLDAVDKLRAIHPNALWIIRNTLEPR